MEAISKIIEEQVYSVRGPLQNEQLSYCCGTILPWRWWHTRLREYLFLQDNWYPNPGPVCKHCGSTTPFINIYGQYVNKVRYSRKVYFYLRRRYWFDKLVLVRTEYEDPE